MQTKWACRVNSLRSEISRADRKSQVRQCLGFCTAALLFSLAYESAEEGISIWPVTGYHQTDRKSQVRLSLADFLSSLAYESAVEKPKYCLTWDFLSALEIMEHRT